MKLIHHYNKKFKDKARLCLFSSFIYASNQPTNQPTNQPIPHSTIQPITELTNQPINQTVSAHSTNIPDNYPTYFVNIKLFVSSWADTVIKPTTL